MSTPEHRKEKEQLARCWCQRHRHRGYRIYRRDQSGRRFTGRLSGSKYLGTFASASPGRALVVKLMICSQVGA